MADRKSTSRKRNGRSSTKRSKPQPGFERPAPPDETNYEHPEPPGTFAPVPGAGALPRETAAEPMSRNPDPRRQAKSTGRRAGRGNASSASSAGADGPSLNVPNDSVGPQPSAPDVPELYDPNYTAASHRRPRPVHHDIGPDGRVSDAMTPDVEYCEPDTLVRIVAEKMADRDVGAIPVIQNMDSMRPVGIITDRDIVVRVVSKGQDPDALRADQVMSIDPATIEVDAPLREPILLMERRKIRRLIVVDRQGRLRGMLAQADIAEATTRLESGELLRQISEPGSQESRGRYH
jgi:CBS domain-containing protein